MNYFCKVRAIDFIGAKGSIGNLEFIHMKRDKENQ